MKRWVENISGVLIMSDLRDKLSIKVYSSDPEVVNTKIESGINYKTPKNRIISSAWFEQVTDNVVVVQIDLHKKYQEPDGYMGKGVWLGKEFLFVDGLDWKHYTAFSETSRYSCFFCLVKEPEDALDRSIPPSKTDYEDTDGCLPFSDYFTILQKRTNDQI